jgi:hypothetical protein
MMVPARHRQAQQGLKQAMDMARPEQVHPRVTTLTPSAASSSVAAR